MAETEIAIKPATQESDPDLTIFDKEAAARGYRTEEELKEFVRIKVHEASVDFIRSLPPPWPTLPREPFKQPKSWEYWKSIARESESDARIDGDKGSK